MTKSRYAFAVLFSILMSQANTLSASPGNFPSDLMYSGKPIDPLCLFDLGSISNFIELQNCGAARQKLSISGQNSNLIKKGFIGFNWQNPADSSQGDSYYKVFAAGNHYYWIYSINNSGGSGDFTAVALVNRKNPATLEIKNVAGGDRCNGGIENPTEHNYKLNYTVNLTAYDFLSLANENPHHLKAYTDLSACAACCAAKAFYEVDSTLKPKLKYVDLGKNGNIAEMSEQGTYHACFNKLVASYISKNETKLDSAQLKKFAKEFNDSCVNHS